MKLDNARINETSMEVLRGMDGIPEFIDDMWKLMYAKKGIGLAAPQVDSMLRIIVIHAGTFKKEFINPVITKKYAGTVKNVEGCLSFPGKQVKKQRYKRIVIEGFDANWNPIKFNLKGIAAYCAQHEVDHLNGVTI